jgi:mono/diheme cytochrome c family protein
VYNFPARLSSTSIADVRKFLDPPMPPREPQSLKARKALFGLLLVVMLAAVMWAIQENRPWTVPEQAKQVKNPLTGHAGLVESVRPLYLDKCGSCHGNTGKGDGHDASLYDPAPTNFTDGAHMGVMTDGELFYKLSEGHKPMPSFKKRLSEDQRWRLVLLLRSFARAPDAAISQSSSSDPRKPTSQR